MKTVTVQKQELLTKLEDNLSHHRADFEIAWDAFQKRAIDNFHAKLALLEDAQRGQQIELWVNLDVPEDHSADYLRAIDMLKWEVGDQVVLTEQEFRQFVQDDWSWKGKFASDNVFYAGSSSPSRASL
jgi:hypothetical protein